MRPQFSPFFWCNRKATVKPYYEEDDITIYHADCNGVVPSVWHDADVMITDPPYGMKYDSGWKSRPIRGDSDVSLRDAVLDIWAGRPALVFGRWSCARPKGIRHLLIWNKGDWPGMGDLSLPWGPSTEEIYVIGDGWIGKRSGSILHYPYRPNGNTEYHPTEKPEGLMDRLIRATNSTVSVIDPFMGTGATISAAKRLNRRAIGIEIEERYCEIAAKRLSQYVLPLMHTSSYEIT